MSAKKTGTAEDRVEVFVPKSVAGDEANLFVSVNGINYLLPRGKKSMVPQEVASEIERAREAAQLQDERIRELLESSAG